MQTSLERESYPETVKPWSDTFVGPGGMSSPSIMHQAGVVVLRPGRLAFIGVGDATTLTGSSLQIVGSSAGERLRGRSLEAELARVSLELGQLPPTEVDAVVPHWIHHYGGIYLPAFSSRVVRKRLLSGERIFIEGAPGRVDIGYTATALQSPTFCRLIAGWPS
jgi:hypothetical protein